MSNNSFSPPSNDSVTDLKLFVGTTPAAQGLRLTINQTGVAHNKVTDISALVNNDPVSVILPEFSAEAGFQYSVWINGSGLNLQLHATNSYNILDKPFVINITYRK